VATCMYWCGMAKPVRAFKLIKRGFSALFLNQELAALMARVFFT
jgi:hypothetical protein